MRILQEDQFRYGSSFPWILASKFVPCFPETGYYFQIYLNGDRFVLVGGVMIENRAQILYHVEIKPDCSDFAIKYMAFEDRIIIWAKVSAYFDLCDPKAHLYNLFTYLGPERSCFERRSNRFDRERDDRFGVPIPHHLRTHCQHASPTFRFNISKVHRESLQQSGLHSRISRPDLLVRRHAYLFE